MSTTFQYKSENDNNKIKLFQSGNKMSLFQKSLLFEFVFLDFDIAMFNLYSRGQNE